MSGAEELRRAFAETLWADDTGQPPETLWSRRDGTQRTYLRVASKLLALAESYGRECAAAALEEAAAAIDRGPTFPMPLSIISALVRERAQDTRAAALKGSEEAET